MNVGSPTLSVGTGKGSSGASPRIRWLAALALALGGLAAYHNSFGVPFAFDDEQSILENPSIRHLGRLADVLSTPSGAGYTVSGRPLANLTLALNYAVSGLDVWSYHWLNLAIHVGAGLVLFGVVRRTLLLPRLAPRFQPSASPLALAIALAWTLHPLQTEAVTYIIQRVESLMGFFFLLTLYAFIRSLDGRRRGFWQGVMWAACLCGMVTKEVMAVAPVMVLLYDRTFVAGGFGEAWRRHRRLYGALALTWLPLLWLVARAGWHRGETSGFDVGITPWAYWLTQFRAVAGYLQLSFWPYPLAIDRAPFWVHGASEVMPYALVVLSVAGAAGVALCRWPALGFLGAWFFGILAPTSFVPGTLQMMVDHRMYLPLAAVISAGVLGLYLLAGRRSFVAVALLVPALGWLTAQRNRDYRSPVVLWQDTVAKCPDNPRAHINLGKALLDAGLTAPALAEYREALRLDPGNVVALFNLANALARDNRLAAASDAYEDVLRRRPDFANAHFYLAEVLERLGRPAQAAEHYSTAIVLDPDLADARCNLGNLLLASGRLPDAIAQYEAALKVTPNSARIHYNLGNAFLAASRLSEAAREYEAAVQEEPDHAGAQLNLANVLFQLGRSDEALVHFRMAVRLQPGAADVHANYGVALLALHRIGEARAEFAAALRIEPANEQARRGMAQTAADSGAPMNEP